MGAISRPVALNFRPRYSVYMLMRTMTVTILLLVSAGCGGGVWGPNSAVGRRNYLSTANVTDDERRAILAGEVLPGMTPDSVLAAWGDTRTKVRAVTADGTVETWAYCAGRGLPEQCPKRVVFRDGRVSEVYATR